MDESRKQFEQEFARRYKFPCQFDRHEKSGEYADIRVRASWRMWVASREAIEIELPEWFSPNDCGDRAMWLDAVEKAIRSAGIKVKE
ncbi:hypothetical protein [Enterobacter hormaechei]|uniref:hypothetical protein n=1 Tax=Enterobacter hormaechei TaxID=158836 RepID=UPI00273863FC|nr:hypothetical protein [Enterobacter hormaechei]MDZ5681681.1 hypothetical protein [Enterobacter hormaechei]WLP13264.1 hypothetical protein Q8Z25_11560 [Enterobacter hormaechei]HCD9772890.1 hypothetical protein [Enterobacter hormaechei]HCE3973781.1 hypothetical protein [Enterobacter hormaechei]